MTNESRCSDHRARRAAFPTRTSLRRGGIGCHVLHSSRHRPQPSDDFEEVVVAGQYVAAIAPTVSNEISAEFEVVQTWVDFNVAAGSFDSIDEPEDGDPVGGAIKTINEFIDTRCLADELSRCALRQPAQVAGLEY